MQVRFVLASSAVTVSLVAFALVVACGGGQRPGAQSATTAGPSDGGVRDATRDAPVTPLFGGACPEDAPWTGAVCLGQGYVACPGGYSMDDRSRCLRDVAAGEAPAVDAADEADDDDPDTDAG